MKPQVGNDDSQIQLHRTKTFKYNQPQMDEDQGGGPEQDSSRLSNSYQFTDSDEEQQDFLESQIVVNLFGLDPQYWRKQKLEESDTFKIEKNFQGIENIGVNEPKSYLLNNQYSQSIQSLSHVRSFIDKAVTVKKQMDSVSIINLEFEDPIIVNNLGDGRITLFNNLHLSPIIQDIFDKVSQQTRREKRKLESVVKFTEYDQLSDQSFQERQNNFWEMEDMGVYGVDVSHQAVNLIFKANNNFQTSQTICQNYTLLQSILEACSIGPQKNQELHLRHDYSCKSIQFNKSATCILLNNPSKDIELQESSLDLAILLQDLMDQHNRQIKQSKENPQIALSVQLKILEEETELKRSKSDNQGHLNFRKQNSQGPTEGIQNKQQKKDSDVQFQKKQLGDSKLFQEIINSIQVKIHKFLGNKQFKITMNKELRELLFKQFLNLQQQILNNFIDQINDGIDSIEKSHRISKDFISNLQKEKIIKKCQRRQSVQSVAKSKITYRNLRECDDLSESSSDSRISSTSSENSSQLKPDTEIVSDNKSVSYKWDSQTIFEKTKAQPRKSVRNGNPLICVHDIELSKVEEVFVKCNNKISDDSFQDGKFDQNIKIQLKHNKKYDLKTEIQVDLMKDSEEQIIETPKEINLQSQPESLISEKETSEKNRSFKNLSTQIKMSKGNHIKFNPNIQGFNLQPKINNYQTQLSGFNRIKLDDKRDLKSLNSINSVDQLSITQENILPILNIKSKYLDLQKSICSLKQFQDKPNQKQSVNQQKFINKDNLKGQLMVKSFVSGDGSPKYFSAQNIQQEYESPLDVYQLNSSYNFQNRPGEDREIRIRTLSSHSVKKQKQIENSDKYDNKAKILRSSFAEQKNNSQNELKIIQSPTKLGKNSNKFNQPFISNSANKTFQTSGSFNQFQNHSTNSNVISSNSPSSTKFLPLRRTFVQNNRPLVSFNNSDSKPQKQEEPSSPLKSQIPYSQISSNPNQKSYIKLMSASLAAPASRVSSSSSQKQLINNQQISSQQQRMYSPASPSPATNLGQQPRIPKSRQYLNRPNRLQVPRTTGGLTEISSRGALQLPPSQNQRRVQFEETPPTLTETNLFQSSQGSKSPETASFQRVAHPGRQTNDKPPSFSGIEVPASDVTFGRVQVTGLSRQDTRRSSQMSGPLKERDTTPPRTFNVMMFGDNRKGACGLDHIENKYVCCPVEMRAHRFTKIACGQLHCLGLNQQGKVVSWGSNKAGQLGRKESDEQGQGPSPVQSIGLNVIIKDIACGFSHSLALSVNGKVFAWGLNICGQLGINNDSMINCDQPQLVTEIPHKVKKIKAGQLHSGAVTEQGDLYMWGHNPDCRLLLMIDNQRTPADRNVKTPQLVSILDKDQQKRLKISELSCGTDHTMVIDEFGGAWAGGNSEWGQLGVPHYDFVAKTCQIPYKKVQGLKGPIKKVCCGDGFSLALSAKGKVFSCGKGNLGRLGHGIEENFGQMAEIQYFRLNDIPIIDIAAGGRHCLALSEDRSQLYVWGCNFHYQLGQYHQDDELKPVKNNYISKKIYSIACGQMNSAVMVEDFS